MVYEEKDHTFVICAYKESEYCESLIKSLLNQTRQSKIIITTSTKTARLVQIAQKYNVPVIENSFRESQATDWNFAYMQAKTKLVTLVRQNDYYNSDYLENILKEINTRKKPLMAFCDYYEINDSGQKIEINSSLIIKRILCSPLRNKVLSSKRFIRKRILSLGCPICYSTITLAKDNLPEKLFEDRLSLDWLAWTKIADMKGDFVYIPKKLVGYRLLTGTSTPIAILSGERKRDDYEMFCCFWPKPIAKILSSIYGLSYKKYIS